MSGPWTSERPWAGPPPTPAGGLRAGLRGAAVAAILAVGLGLLLLIRLVERPVFGAARPASPWVTCHVCRLCLRVLGLRVSQEGAPMDRPGVLVANHASWLDILVLNAPAPVYFVAKAEVAGWPGIGLLARATGTVFVARERREAAAQAALLRARLAAGHRLLIFPEGTSSDGRRVLPFKATLFAALQGSDGPAPWVQPVSLIYTAPARADPRFYGWWGDMELGPHLLAVLAIRRNGAARIVWHPPLATAGADRKALARAAEAAVRAGMEKGLSRDPAAAP